MADATFDSFLTGNDPLARMGWNPEYGQGGQIIGYWRPTSLDPARGANQQGVVAGSDTAFEYVPADKINGGEPAASDLEYRTAGTNVAQNDPRGWGALSTIGPLIIGASAGGALGETLGLFGPGGFNGMTGLGEAAGGLAGTPEITAEMLAAANATSDPIAYLAAQANAVAPGSWGALDPAYLASLTTVPPGTITPGYQAPPSWPDTAAPAPTGGPSTPTGTNTPPVSPGGGGGGNTGIGLPTDLAGWAKLLGPLVGGGLLAYEASQQNGQQNPQDEFTRDWARGNLNKGWAPLPTNVTGGYRDAATSGLLGGNPAMPGLLQKRYY